MCMQGSPEHEGFLVWDPKLPPGRAGLERAKGPFREAIVFMVGGTAPPPGGGGCLAGGRRECSY
jgi:hypothetical protein